VNAKVYEGVKDLDFKTHSVIKLSEFGVKTVKDKKVITLSRPFDLLGYCSILGDPSDYWKLEPSEFNKNLNLCFKIQNENVDRSNSIEETKDDLAKPVEESKSASFFTPREEEKSNIVPKYSSKGIVKIIPNSEMPHDYTPIAALNPMNPDWMIKVRVTKKCPPRHWRNFRGEGDLMNIELKDEYGDQIQGTFFNKHVNKYDEVIKEGKVYAIQFGQIKSANPRYSSIKNPYCISFNGRTVITELIDDGAIPQDGFCYYSLKEASKMDNGKIIDVKGIVFSVEDMAEITMKNGISKPIRRVIIGDNSKMPGLSMQVTFWGKIAYKANLSRGDCIALKDAKVGTYNAISLNMSDECDVKRIHDQTLIKWFEGLKDTKDIISLSDQNKDNLKNKDAGMKPMLIDQINQKVHEEIEEQTTPNYIIEGYLTFIAKAANMIYMACPEDKKKLQKEFGKDEWLCER
jgi:hypothetical protein